MLRRRTARPALPCLALRLADHRDRRRGAGAAVAATAALELGADDSGAVDQGAQLAERDLARQELHPAIGADAQPLRLDMLERRPYPFGDLAGRLDAGIAEVEHADREVFVLDAPQQRQIES